MSFEEGRFPNAVSADQANSVTLVALGGDLPEEPLSTEFFAEIFEPKQHLALPAYLVLTTSRQAGGSGGCVRRVRFPCNRETGRCQPEYRILNHLTHLNRAFERPRGIIFVTGLMIIVLQVLILHLRPPIVGTVSKTVAVVVVDGRDSRLDEAEMIGAKEVTLLRRGIARQLDIQAAKHLGDHLADRGLIRPMATMSLVSSQTLTASKLTSATTWPGASAR